MSTLKILASGPVNGRHALFFERINKVNKKNGPFDMILVVGSFFSDNSEENQDWVDQIKRKELSIPQIPIYILGPQSSSQALYYRNKEDDQSSFENGFEITEGITFLGRKGVLTGSSGLRIAYLSGKESEQVSNITYTKDDVRNLVQLTESSSSPIDVLITSHSPSNFIKYLDFIPPEMKTVSDEGSELISRLAYHLKPRYHFAAGQYFTERRPYRNHVVLQESQRQATRFYSLASVGNVHKSKWLYAFNISPSNQVERKELVKQPEGTTERPYSFSDDWSEQQTAISKDQFFYDASYQESDQQTYQRKGTRRQHDNFQRNQNQNHQPRQNLDDGDRQNKRFQDDRQQSQIKCWFCLASPDVEKHLIVSIGDLCYLALPKGGLVDGHCLILPVAHYRSFLESSNNKELVSEVERFKKAIGDYYCTKDCVPIFFERNFRTYHFQLQAIPVPKNITQSIEESLIELSGSKGFSLKPIPVEMELKDVLSPGLPYFYIEIPDIKVKMYTQIKRLERNADGNQGKGQDNHFPIQFGRELLADPKILNIPNRVDWKNCSISKEEETEETKTFRESFKPFDFTLE